MEEVVDHNSRGNNVKVITLTWNQYPETETLYRKIPRSIFI